MTIACTYAPLSELSDCTRLTDIDTPVDKGEFIIFYDGEKVKVVRGVNSFVTTIDGKGDSFKKIKIVEAMDMINDDITKRHRIVIQENTQIHILINACCYRRLVVICTVAA